MNPENGILYENIHPLISTGQEYCIRLLIAIAFCLIVYFIINIIIHKLRDIFRGRKIDKKIDYNTNDWFDLDEYLKNEK